jgi:hypothetical protein
VAALPPTYPLTPDMVKAWLRLPDTADDQLLADCVAATTAFVARTPYAGAAVPDETTGVVLWPDDALQGAVMLAARMYRRRNTPSGIEAFTDAVVYVPRRDSDVDMLLRVGGYATPQVG